jgi:hypothetical protein
LAFSVRELRRTQAQRRHYASQQQRVVALQAEGLVAEATALANALAAAASNVQTRDRLLRTPLLFTQAEEAAVRNACAKSVQAQAAVRATASHALAILLDRLSSRGTAVVTPSMLAKSISTGLGMDIHDADLHAAFADPSERSGSIGGERGVRLGLRRQVAAALLQVLLLGVRITATAATGSAEAQQGQVPRDPAAAAKSWLDPAWEEVEAEEMRRPSKRLKLSVSSSSSSSSSAAAASSAAASSHSGGAAVRVGSDASAAHHYLACDSAYGCILGIAATGTAVARDALGPLAARLQRRFAHDAEVAAAQCDPWTEEWAVQCQIALARTVTRLWNEEARVSDEPLQSTAATGMGLSLAVPPTLARMSASAGSRSLLRPFRLFTSALSSATAGRDGARMIGLSIVRRRGGTLASDELPAAATAAMRETTSEPAITGKTDTEAAGHAPADAGACSRSVFVVLKPATSSAPGAPPPAGLSQWRASAPTAGSMDSQPRHVDASRRQQRGRQEERVSSGVAHPCFTPTIATPLSSVSTAGDGYFYSPLSLLL